MTHLFRTSFLLLAAVAFTAAGCDFEQFDGAYDGDPVMEFDQVPGGPYSLSVAEGSGTVSLRTNLVGQQQGSDKTLSFTVSESSTAVEGTHYSLPNGTEYSLPANSSFGDIEINVLDDSLEPGQSGTIVLELQGSTDGTIGAAENLDDFTITIVGA